MNNKKLIDINYPIEEVEKNLLKNIPSEYFQHSLMIEDERNFINGIIREFKPKEILEVGLYKGVGSAVILNSIHDLENSKLISIDIAKAQDGVEVAYIAKELFGSTSKWDLITGVDPAEVLEDLDKKFDLLVIDAAHYMPGEVLNFLGILPFLSDDAIVIVHDISRHLIDNREYACHNLFSSIVADKLIPFKDKSIKNGFYTNIGAFQINKDTKKYIDNIFHSLRGEWQYIVSEKVIKSYRKIIEKNYTSYHLELFDDAVRLNNKFDGFLKNITTEDYKKYADSKKVIFYGLPETIENTLFDLDKNNLERPNYIWNKNAKNLDDILGMKVDEPDFGIFKANADYLVVLFLWISSKDVGEQLKKLGVQNIIHYVDFDGFVNKSK